MEYQGFIENLSEGESARRVREYAPPPDISFNISVVRLNLVSFGTYSTESRLLKNSILFLNLVSVSQLGRKPVLDKNPNLLVACLSHHITHFSKPSI